MITLREISYGLFGAWRLAHLDRSGLQYLDDSVEGFWRSFWAAALAAPGYLMLVSLRLSDKPLTSGPGRIFLIELIGYVIGWTLFPLAAWYLVGALGRSTRYIRYIVAYNWANVLQIALYVPVAVFAAGDVLPLPLTSLLGLAATAAVLYYQFFIARSALEIDPLPAAGLVAMDLMLGVLLSGIVDAMETG